MASRGASARRNSCNFVVSSIRENRSRFLASLDRTLREPLPEDRQIPDVGEFIDVLAEGLEVRGKQMLAADLVHLDEIGGDSKHREMRDEANDRLIGKYIRQRSVFIGAFGDTAARDVGFEPVVEREPKRLELQVRRVKDRLETPDLVLPAMATSGLTFEPVAFAQGFEPEYGQLVEANDNVLKEQRKADTSLIAKRAAVDDYDQWFVWVAGTWESLLRLAGMFDEAQRVRPSLRRPGRRAEDAESDRQDSADPPKDSPASDRPPGDPPAEPPPLDPPDENPQGPPDQPEDSRQ